MKYNSYTKNLTKAKDILGSWDDVAQAFGISVRALSKWRKKGVPPRTEYTKETKYAKMLADKVSEAGGDLVPDDFLPDYVKSLKS